MRAFLGAAMVALGLLTILVSFIYGLLALGIQGAEQGAPILVGGFIAGVALLVAAKWVLPPREAAPPVPRAKGDPLADAERAQRLFAAGEKKKGESAMAAAWEAAVATKDARIDAAVSRMYYSMHYFREGARPLSEAAKAAIAGLKDRPAPWSDVGALLDRVASGGAAGSVPDGVPSEIGGALLELVFLTDARD